MSERFPGEFDDLVQRLTDGCATDEERGRFAALLQEDAALRVRYAELMRIHALLVCRYKGVGQQGGRCGAQCGPSPRKGRDWGWWKWKAAAAAAALLTGAAVSLTPSSVRHALSSASAEPEARPVQLVEPATAQQLELPPALPGTVRIGNGLAKVRLPSGVELALIGPLSLEVKSDMEVRLVSGRLVAWVPPRASGFTVHAPGLTVWDIGTVFSVSADKDGGGVFVFKGSVQVLDGEGEGVGLCEAGEGVLSETRGSVVKIAADWPEAQALLTSVRDRAALDAPEKALSAAWQVAVLWSMRYMPGLTEKRNSALCRRSVKSLARQAVPVNEEKVMNMKNVVAAAGIALASIESPAAETNIVSFAYGTSIEAHASTPDPLLRRLNDGFWTNSVTDGVRYDGDVTVTLEFPEATRVTGVEAYTVTAAGATPLETQGVALSCSVDGQAWTPLGAMQAGVGGRFSSSGIYAVPRFLRVTCTKSAAAVGQALAEIVVAGGLAGGDSLLSFAYTASPTANPVHGDDVFTELTDGVWTNAAGQSVQYGAKDLASVIPDDPVYCVASSAVINVTLSGVRRVRHAHLYAYRNNTAAGYATARVTVSNSLDGVTWTCAGEQTEYESFTNQVVRFDFTLPNVEARYLTFVCEKVSRTDITRQLLGELQILGSEAQPVWGEPLSYTYVIDGKQVGSNGDGTSWQPRLTDRTWEHVSNNGIRLIGDVVITADLGAAQYLAGARLHCFGPTKYTTSNGWYGTKGVLAKTSLDGETWVDVAEVTNQVAFTYSSVFTNRPYARYVRLNCSMCDDEPTKDFVDQILGELIIYRPPAWELGAAPVEVAGAIPFGSFETEPVLAPMAIVKGGTTNGWTFSYTSANNYAGYQINGSTVSSNGNVTRYYAPEGSQTAVLVGSGAMETQIAVPTAGRYMLQFQMNSATVSAAVRGPYDFRVRVDGAEQAVIWVMNQAYVTQEIVLPALTAGAHVLRFEGINTRAQVGWGVLVDDLRLKRYETPAEQVLQQGRGTVLVADSWAPLSLSYDGRLTVKELWVEGALQSPGKYGDEDFPTVFEGPGVIGYGRGTVFSIQ